VRGWVGGRAGWGICIEVHLDVAVPLADPQRDGLCQVERSNIFRTLVLGVVCTMERTHIFFNQFNKEINTHKDTKNMGTKSEAREKYGK
jgi:hypothetical protein